MPVDLVVDHSVMIDYFGTKKALDLNMQLEFKRNLERYQFMKWGMQAFDTFGVVPPGFGIVHQVNLEYLARGVHKGAAPADGVPPVYYPDSLVGTDSHTTMINGIGVVGWGVGGIEGEAAMLGQPVYFLTPDVVGFEFNGRLREGVTATDLVLTVTEILRREKVVGKFVEFFGAGVESLSVPDRATIANMAPEYGATMGFFPVDDKTIEYFRGTGRTAERDRILPGVLQGAGPVRHAARRRHRLQQGRPARPRHRGAEPVGPAPPAGPDRARPREGAVHVALQQAAGGERLQPAGRPPAHAPPRARRRGARRRRRGRSGCGQGAAHAGGPAGRAALRSTR